MKKILWLGVFLGGFFLILWIQDRFFRPEPPPPRQESQLTIIEGWTVNDEIKYLLQEKQVTSTVSAASVGRSINAQAFDDRWRTEFSFLKSLPAGRSLEGYLFPDTYRVWDDQLPEGLVRKQLREFQDRFGGATIGSSSAPLKTLDEVVTLASIVEGEVRKPEDRKLVAGIFLKRLKVGMALQTDATLSYFLGSNRARATAADLAVDSPYNSYKYPGLPPSPIGQPGDASMRAVLEPTKSSYWFFLTDRQGKVFYAKTFEEHLRNKRKAGY
ncbi:MAG: endolytic transglycosylase MltG [Candidatus Uhrbacteria bacterium]|nr:endolytic transglycosylase MltG [Candidatus Uhrbacteria bacterium]